MRVLVTGADGGIGGATVERFLEQGADVIAHDLRPGEDRAGVRWVAGDLSSDEGLTAVADAIAGGPLDAVVAAHGVEGSGAVATIPDHRARRIVELNYVTVVALHDVVAAALGSDGDGAFVVIASQAGLHGEANNGAYCAGKFALVGWARVMAAERERSGIHVHAVCPGCTDTPLLQGALDGMARDEGVSLREMNGRRVASIPAGRLARPSEIAGMVVLLCTLRGSGAAVAPITGGEVLA